MRAGQVIKEYLEVHGVASIADLHHAYRVEIDRANEQRGTLRKDKLRSMTYESFRTIITRAKKAGLLENFGSGDIVRPYPGSDQAPFLGIRDGQVVTQRYALLQLTEKGRQATEEWDSWRNM